MKLAIVGSRTWKDRDLIRRALLEIQPTIVISGGASGADYIAHLEADRLHIPVVVYKAEWARFGKSAGAKRNQTIVNECDKLIAFWDGVSKGTAISIQMAKCAGKLLRVILDPRVDQPLAEL